MSILSLAPAAGSVSGESYWEKAYPIIPHPGEFIVGLICFALLYAIVKSKVVPLFEKALAERQNAIEGGLQRAEQAQAEANEARETYRAQLADARGEAAQIRAEAQSERKAIIEAARVEAETTAARVAERGRAQLAAEVNAARTELSRTVGTLAVDLASRILGENLADTEVTRRTVDRAIADLDQSSREIAGQH